MKDMRALAVHTDGGEVAYDFTRNREEQAEAKGCIIVYPKSTELQLDIDTDVDYDRFLAASTNLGEFITDIQIRPSASGGPHKHITLTIESEFLSPLEKIALQFMLGSDFIRESLSALRVVRGVADPTCFFEPKGETE